MSIETELAAIRESAAIYPLTDRGFLRITGPDATRWLNGMVTNSIQSLAPGEGNYNFLLNAQGRIQGDCTIYRDGEFFLLATDLAQRDAMLQHLEKFIIMDDVELASEDLTGLCIVGYSAYRCAFELCDALNAKTAPEQKSVGEMRRSPYRGGRQIFIYPPALQPMLERVEIYSPDAQETLTTERTLTDNGVHNISAQAIEALRILEGRPKFGVDIRDRDLPQETGQTHALHFNKGCYLGQEIVERIRSRGQVHRQFTPLQLAGSLPALPALPAPLEANGKAVGEVTSAVQIGDEIVALGYVRREVFHETLTYPGGTAAIRHTPAIG